MSWQKVTLRELAVELVQKLHSQGLRLPGCLGAERPSGRGPGRAHSTGPRRGGGRHPPPPPRGPELGSLPRRGHQGPGTPTFPPRSGRGGVSPRGPGPGTHRCPLSAAPRLRRNPPPAPPHGQLGPVSGDRGPIRARRPHVTMPAALRMRLHASTGQTAGRSYPWRRPIPRGPARGQANSHNFFKALGPRPDSSTSHPGCSPPPHRL